MLQFLRNEQMMQEEGVRTLKSLERGIRRRTNVLRTLSDLEALAGDRCRSQRSPQTPASDYIWAKSCARKLLGGDDLWTLIAGSLEEPAGIAVLSRERRSGAPLRFPGIQLLGEPTDFLYADQLALDDLARGLAASRIPLYLGRILADSPTVESLRRAYGRSGIVIIRPEGGCPWIPLDEGWSEPEKHLSSRRRSDFRRMRRKAEKAGTVTSEVLVPTSSNLESLLQEAFSVEASSWKGREGTALAKDEQQAEFFREYARLACERGMLRLCFLRIDGQAVAMQIAIEEGGGFWLMKIGYDEEFSRCSPGILLMAETIRYAAKAGLASYELLGNEASWTRTWTRHIRACVSIRAYPLGLRGGVAMARDLFGAVVRRLGRATATATGIRKTAKRS
jgi:hypothetical protein